MRRREGRSAPPISSTSIPPRDAGVGRLGRASLRPPLAGILGYEERPLVSVDFKGDPRSAIVDGPSTMIVDRTLVKIYAWYDNEWGYANRMAELARKVSLSL
jgi:glyceraldehyde-3-phosphate dehydrogenase (arsenate-transferring)